MTLANEAIAQYFHCADFSALSLIFVVDSGFPQSVECGEPNRTARRILWEFIVKEIINTILVEAPKTSITNEKPAGCRCLFMVI